MTLLANARMPARFPWLSLIFLLLLLAALAFCSGCTQRDIDAAKTAHRFRKVREEPTATGGKVTVEEEWTDTEEHRTERAGLDDSWTQVAQAGAAAIGKAATGDWTGAIATGAGALASLAAVVAAAQRSRANAADKRADEHKADAAEAWGEIKAMATTKGDA